MVFTRTGLLAICLVESPVFLVYLAGLVLAIVRWPRQPRASLLALLGLLVLAGNSLAGMATNFWLPFALQGGRFGFGILGNAMGILRLGQAVLTALGLSLLLAAVFAGRGTSPAVAPQQ